MLRKLSRKIDPESDEDSGHGSDVSSSNSVDLDQDVGWKVRQIITEYCVVVSRNLI